MEGELDEERGRGRGERKEERTPIAASLPS